MTVPTPERPAARIAAFSPRAKRVLAGAFFCGLALLARQLLQQFRQLDPPLAGEGLAALGELQQFSDAIGEDVFEVLTLEGSVAARNHIGGTAPEQVRAAIARARAKLDA